MAKKNSKKPELASIQERAQQYIEDDKKLMRKYSLTKKVVVMFPRHAKVPILGRLALRLFKWSKGVIDLQFIHIDE